MLDDDGKLKRKFSNKRVNARKEGIEFLLTFKEFSKLVRDAGITSSDLGFTGRNFVLARFNDTGPYKVGNCRFITQHENALEKTLSNTEIASNIRNITSAAAVAARERKLAGDRTYLRLAGQKGAKTRHVQQRIAAILSDIRLIDLPVDVCAVDFPRWGWITRLSKELGASLRQTQVFLKRTPEYIETLKIAGNEN